MHVVGPRATRWPDTADVAGHHQIIMIGLAGALDPTLAAGEVVIDESSSVDVSPGPWRRGRIYTTDRIVATPAEKAALFASTGAFVVDMESAIVRAFADSCGLPFLGIRAVSDRADESLDPATLAWIDDAGQLRPRRVAMTLCRRPMLIPSLVRLRKRSNLALGNLASALQTILAKQPALQPVTETA